MRIFIFPWKMLHTQLEAELWVRICLWCVSFSRNTAICLSKLSVLPKYPQASTPHNKTLNRITPEGLIR